MRFKCISVITVLALMLINIVACGSAKSVLSITNNFSVDFPDKNLELVIREAINKPEGNILNSDLQSLTSFDCQ